MNYIREINAFERRMRRSPLPTTAQLLWYKLMQFANRLHWPECFSIDNDRLILLMNVSSEKTLRAAREVLLEEGYIVFERGAKGRPSSYRIISVDKMERLENGVDFTEEDAEPEDGFMLDKEDIASYFGYTETLGLELKKITKQLYETYLPTERPTEQDERRVFLHIKSQEQGPGGEWVMTFPQAAKELLAYAFEEASKAGAVNWNYIEGIYRNLGSRGIKTVDQAYEYEAERDQRKGRW